ncbi:hypothetical protein C2S51_031183 [Perilla frutescens var. frutescens]|nr:hypothetical protein C2S51_031183 [Perilla frutescens var. frutescens]
MSKKMKIIPSIFKNKQAKHHPWQWPSCKHPKTLSFRAHDVGCDHIFPTNDYESSTTEHSSNNCASFSTDDEDTAAPSLEVMISTVRLSERLFFEPEETSSIVNINKDSKNGNSKFFPFKDSVAMALESDDPYLDFKKSMEEMVESNEGLLKDWDCLEELLLWYLKMNGKINHRFIVGAFVDLLVGFSDVDSRKKKTTMMVSTGSGSTTTVYSSASSSFSSPSSYPSPHSR